MKFEDVLKTRRTIRSYTREPVTPGELEVCLNAAILAPSWKNSQTARFYVVRTPEALEEIRTRCLPEGNARKVENAPVLIVETFVKGISGTGNDGQFANEGQDGWGWYDLGLATENLCLQARDLGLGTLIMGIRDEEALRSFLRLPENEQVGAIIALGHPDGEPPVPPRHAIEDCTHFF